MKMIVCMIILACAAPAFGLVNQWDPNLTPEQRERAEQINANIRDKNEKTSIERNKEIAVAAQKFENAVIDSKSGEEKSDKEIRTATKKFIKKLHNIRRSYPPIVG